MQVTVSTPGKPMVLVAKGLIVKDAEVIKDGVAINVDYRPFTGMEDFAFNTDYQRFSGAAKAELVTAELISRIVRWDVLDVVDGKRVPVPINRDTVNRLPYEFIIGLVDLLSKIPDSVKALGNG